jgi:hypothetical protein
VLLELSYYDEFSQEFSVIDQLYIFIYYFSAYDAHVAGLSYAIRHNDTGFEVKT